MTRYTTPLTISKTDSGVRYFDTVIPTPVELRGNEILYETKIGDRWDLLAYQYYRNASLWYIIAKANNGLNGSIFIKPGTTVIIPEV